MMLMRYRRASAFPSPDLSSGKVPKLKNVSLDEETLKKLKPTPTGVHDWELRVNKKTGKLYFLNPTKEKRSWGLPLKDVYIIGFAARENYDKSDDWECFVDPDNLERYYRSLKRNRLQTKIPKRYRMSIGALPFFTNKYTKESIKKLLNGDTSEAKAEKVESPTPAPHKTAAKAAPKAIKVKETKAESLQELLKNVTLPEILEDSLACAGLHRYLIATKEEAKLLFLASIEIFKSGMWHGIAVLGAGMANEKEDEGSLELQQQLEKSNAQVRVGVDQSWSVKEQASHLYMTFMDTTSPLWLKLPAKTARIVKSGIEKAPDDFSLLLAFETAIAKLTEQIMEQDFNGFVSATMGFKKQKRFKTNAALQQRLRKIASDYV